MELSAGEIWNRVLESVRAGLPAQSFRTWLSGTRAISMSDREVVVEVPSDFHRDWIEDKFAPVLQEALQGVLGRNASVSFQPAAESPRPGAPDVEVDSPGAARTAPGPGIPAPGPSGSGSAGRHGASPAPPERPGAASRGPAGLNERYTFERFVVGSNNQLASAAGHAVADQPARAYNPLFLYGGVGLGKTHLMHAIGNQVVATEPSLRVAYVTTERFMNELIDSIQERSTPEFRRRYRDIDLLLVDDVHFLQGKEWTQEEFFHTFNALYDARKQIVLTSDRPPKEIPGLEERLVSRFEWGLVADIKPPDYETRVAILRKKGDDDALTLADDVIDFIARYCTSSVRELEGAIIKLLAYSSLRKQDITVELAGEALDAVIRPDPSREGKISPERVREVVAVQWEVDADALSSRRRTREVTVPRQVAMYLIKELVDPPLVQIGRLFGGRDHSTVIHSIRKVEEAIADDPDFRGQVERARRELTNRGT